MKITLHMATSIDGFIARVDGDSSWVSSVDAALFEARCKSAGCIVLGRTTYDQYHGELYPISDITNIVLSSRPLPDALTAPSPLGAVAAARIKGHDQILLAGGGKTNAGFLQSNLIDEIFLSTHPIMLGEGIRLFEGASFSDKFTLVDTSPLDDGLTQMHYKKAS